LALHACKTSFSVTHGDHGIDSLHETSVLCLSDPFLIARDRLLDIDDSRRSQFCQERPLEMNG
jgi:hypothetical protein